MELIGYENKDKWIKLSEESSIKVDYPDIEQQFRLEQIQFSSMKFDDEGTPTEYDLAGWNKYVRFYLKFTIKDWKGFKSDGKEIKCKLENNELANDLFEALIRDRQGVSLIYQKINEVLKWDETQKKS